VGVGAVREQTRNPHAGEPFIDDDAFIAAALDDVSVPALLCSLVHMTGDPSWIRGDVRPRTALSFDVQGRIRPEEQADVRQRALPAIAAYRDGGCIPHELPADLLREMMSVVGCRSVEGRIADFFLENLHFDGADSDAITWGDKIDDDVKEGSPVVVVGCGMGGILAAIRLAQAGLPFTIVDKNAGPGGTWWENRYPGARVDVASHQYCYSFEPADHWSEYYCQHPELREYFARILDKYELRDRCRFETTVVSLAWDDERAEWRLTTRAGDGTEDVLHARFVISAVGSLNLPKLPDIPGMASFAGPSFHSARWPEDLDITGTHFALLGAGASGFQIAPAIADRVAHLTIFQRTAQWMLPNLMYHEKVLPGDRWALRHLPFYGRWLRFLVTYPGVALGPDPYRVDPSYAATDGHAVNPSNAQRRDQLVAWLMSFLDDRPDLVDKVIPDYPAMGKRILQDNGSWMRCLKKPNVELVRTGIERIVPDGVVTLDGRLHEADVICYATGFRHNQYLAPMEVTGRAGVSLREQWGDEPTAYLGITVPNFPNLFMLYGPGTNLAHSASLFLHSEFQVHYTMDAIHRVLAAGARTIEVDREAHDEYVQRYEKEIGQLVWSHPSITHSHYKNPAGKVYTLWPWSVDQYWEWTRAVEPTQYIIR
jgi:4-hydroxyacetophenone monooxygenase